MSPDPARLSLSAPEVATAADWEDSVAAVLRKSGRFTDSDDRSAAPTKLAKKTTDGIVIAPLAGSQVARELTSGPAGADAVRGNVASTAREPGDVPTWDLRIRLDDPAQRAAGELEGGGASLWCSTRTVGDLARALDGVLLDIAPVVLDSPQPLTDGAQLASLAGGNLHPDSNLGLDATGDLLLSGTASDQDVAAAAEFARTHRIRAFVIDASIVHDAGAGEVLELAYAAASVVHLLRLLDDADVAPVDALPLIEFRFAATDQQFTTIAKLRAARAMFARICQVLGVDDDVQHQHVVTSGRMMTRFDPWTNLLRTTIATFAAGIGGADAITVQEYDAAIGHSDDFGRRIARNISNLLVHESHIRQVHDPAGGAGSIEKLTDDLARAAWTQFQEIEAAGDIRAFIQEGALGRALDEALTRRTEAIAKRKQPVTGVSEFPLADEALLERPAKQSRFTESALITPVHDASGFEELRHDPARRPVFLWPIGPLAQHSARATFATNLLAAGGIPVVQGTAGADVDSLIAAARDARTSVVCLIGSDDGYRHDGPELIPAIREAGFATVLNAGKPVDELADLVDDFMAVGSDVLAFLTRTRSALEDTK